QGAVGVAERRYWAGGRERGNLRGRRNEAGQPESVLAAETSVPRCHKVDVSRDRNGYLGSICWRIDLEDEAAAGARLVGAGRRREVGRAGLPADVGVAGGVQGDAEAGVVAAAPEIAGEEQVRAGGVQHRHESVVVAAVGRLKGVLGREDGR